MADRPQRFCDVCKQVDDHPRHVNPPNAPGSTRHLDCCAEAGCEVCQATEEEYGRRRGQELIDHLDEVRG